jgi:hypothetical protein
MNTIHFNTLISASSKETLKQALQMIIDRLDKEEIATVVHDDYSFNFETFDNSTLEIFDIDPEEFLYQELNFLNKGA